MPALPWKYGLIPGTVGLAFALRIVAARGLSQPPLLQEFRTQLAYRRKLVDLDVAEKAEALAKGACSAEFASR
jgi:hypothetical protein